MKNLFLIHLLLINLYSFDEGELFFDGNCVTCHFKSKKTSAPSIKEVKENYLRAFPKEENFVEYMTTWVLKPKEETSLMQNAIKEFGLMPELGYDEYTLKKISKYIYETDFNKPH